jgi:hypothetical protein
MFDNSMVGIGKQHQLQVKPNPSQQRGQRRHPVKQQAIDREQANPAFCSFPFRDYVHFLRMRRRFFDAMYFRKYKSINRGNHG